MLYPAQLYKEELKRKLVERWYDPRCQWYFSGEFYEHTVPDNLEWKQDFVQIGSDGSVTGYFGYAYDECSKSIRNLGLISFTDDKTDRMSLCYDAIKRIKYLFERGAQRLEFWAFTDNPITETYQRLIMKHGGRIAGYLHRTAYFNGKYHDTVFFELLAESIKKG